MKFIGSQICSNKHWGPNLEKDQLKSGDHPFIEAQAALTLVGENISLLEFQLTAPISAVQPTLPVLVNMDLIVEKPTRVRKSGEVEYDKFTFLPLNIKASGSMLEPQC